VESSQINILNQSEFIIHLCPYKLKAGITFFKGYVWHTVGAAHDLIVLYKLGIYKIGIAYEDQSTAGNDKANHEVLPKYTNVTTHVVMFQLL
jgi:hypothetical protein